MLHHGAPLVFDICVGSEVFRCLTVCMEEPPALRSLTSAERAIAVLAGSGLAARQIAQKRGTSVRTVENQLALVFRKLGVSCRAELCELLSIATPKR